MAFDPSPDFYQNLTNMGLAAMAAGAQPGATTMGALGQAGLTMGQLARERNMQNAQLSMYGQDIASKKLQNALALRQVNMQNSLWGLPQLDASGNPAQQGQAGQGGATPFDMGAATQSGQSQPIAASQPSAGQNIPIGGTRAAYKGPATGSVIQPAPSAPTQPSGLQGSVQAFREWYAGAPLTPQRASAILPIAGLAGLTDAQQKMMSDIANSRTIASEQAAGSLPSELTKIGEQGRQARLTEGAKPQKISPGEQIYYPGGVNGGGYGQGGGIPGVSGQGQPGVTIQGNTVSGMSLGDKAYQDQHYKDLAEFEKKTNDDALSAVNLNSTFDRMRLAGQEFNPNAFGEWRGDFAENMQAILQTLAPQGTPTPFDTKAKSYVDIVKNAGIVTREVTRQVSARPAVMEFQMIQKSLPGANTPEGAYNQMLDELQSDQDFKIAQAKALTSWKQGHSTPEGFQQEFTGKVSPAVFLVNRMSPQDFQAMRDGMLKQSGGPRMFKQLMQKVQSAHQMGLIE